jgi:intracellular sulfur oxidation DsrE/DsrF family protein
MSDYFIIQSQDPFTDARTEQQYALAVQLREAGHGVQLLLVQNGVTPARRDARCPAFDRLLQQGVQVRADGLSLQQREIDSNDLKALVNVGDVALVIDALLAGYKVIWN